MSNADAFLELYKNLEELLEVRYSDGRKYAGSTVMRFYNDEDGKKWREELNVCREMRNMLSHHADIDGQPVFEPSDAVLRVLENIIEDVKNPPVAMSIATPAKSLLTCSYGDKAEDVMRKMKECGYSHVPVIEDGRLVGVFSVGTAFSMIEKYGLDRFRSNVLIGELAEFLPIDRHMTESFGFTADTTPYRSLRNRFAGNGPKNRRLAALFVTQNGRENGKVLGIITPWDMIKGDRE